MTNLKDITFKHVTGIAMIIFFGVVIYSLAFREIPEANREVFVHMLGILEGVIVTIVTYYYGSSSGSKTKTEIIEEELDKK
jgi:archaellum component FlaF (FlaF/FlaG flagellin family)